jgi:2-phospho-L-lactate/phosphoenolpyruvate guanylyltransferase
MNAEVLIAARGGPAAKSRLADRLGPDQREALVEAMLGDMLTALAACPAVLRTYVTTPTPALARLAARSGAVVFLEQPANDLNGAFDRARRRIAAADPETTLVLLPGDLPRLDPDDLEQCLEAAGSDRLVATPAYADGGTGALVLPAAVALPLAFGPGSFGKHLAAARSLGLATEVVHAPGLGFDLDRPSDLDAFLTLAGRGRTADLLRGWRVAA